MTETNDAEKIEIIRQILAEPMPKWFQNDHRRANTYAEQIQRISAVVDWALAEGGRVTLCGMVSGL